MNILIGIIDSTVPIGNQDTFEFQLILNPPCHFVCGPDKPFNQPLNGDSFGK